MSTVRPNLLGYALCDFVPDNVLCSTGFALISPNDLHDSQFIYQHLYSDFVQRQLHGLITGSNYPAVNSSDVKKLKIFFPTKKAERQKIAAILSTWDEDIARTERLIAALQSRKKGLMQRLLTGEVRFPGFDGEWEEVPLGDMDKVTSGGTPSTMESDFWSGDILWATPTDITRLETKYIQRTSNTITDAGLANSSSVLLPPGSLLICTRATIGEVAINLVPIATNQGFKKIIPNHKFVPEFILHLLKFYKHILVRYANGSTFLELSKNDFTKLQFSVPKKDEQKRIADVLNACDTEIELLREKVNLLQEQKKGLMQRLLTSEVRVKVQGTLEVPCT